MAPYFVSHPVALALTLATALAWAVLDRVHEARHRSGGGRRRDRGSYWLLVACTLASCVLALLSTAGKGGRIPGQPLPFALGLAAAWGGLALRLAAFRALGRDFTFHVETRAGQGVVATGPYRLLRHPGYSAYCLILVGLGLMCGTWLGLAAVTVLPGVALAYRIRVEERALVADLGEAYEAFAATRKRLIPFVW